MISRNEVMDFATQFGLQPNVIEKDYVLGWLLAGITNHPELNNKWSFKGGTCLKKCYFETYRFSEDLDFTLEDDSTLSQEVLVRIFNEIGAWVSEQSGIEIPNDTIRFDVYKNKRGGLSAEGKIGYRGPLQRRGDPARIKLDLTSDEVQVLESVMVDVNHPYSDKPSNGIQVRCYAFEEVFAEKIRALAERERPRDLYDVIHLYRHDELKPNRTVVNEVLREKCQFKGIGLPNFESLANSPERAELESEWDNMLSHQLTVLPPFQQFWDELPKVFIWLYGEAEKEIKNSIKVAGERIDESWRPPAMVGGFGQRGNALEIIRFAAANRLCVELSYQGKSRVIEPYSLRRSQDGNILLQAIRSDNGEARSYRIDRIEGAKATNKTFSPRFAIELTPVMNLFSIPTKKTSPPLRRMVSMPAKKRSTGLTYKFRCSVCGKKFSKKSFDASLNKHQRKGSKSPCSGRTGIYEGTQY